MAKQQSETKQPIQFMALRRVTGSLSIIFVLVSIVMLATRGLNFGLDFTGGTLVEVNYSSAVPLPEIRATLAKAGYEGAVVVNFGTDTDVLVRLPKSENPKLGEELLATLQQDFSGEIELRRVEFVGPQVGEQLKEQGGLALLMALGLVLIYIAFRFQFKFAIGAVAALAHDVTVVLGCFAIFQWDFDLTVLAAVLAVVGYSLNDTIVVFDRIRENFRKLRKGDSAQVIDISLTETLGRTLATSGTTLLVLACLAVFGGEMIRGFAEALIIGIGFGTYSSIYIASNLLLSQNIQREDLMMPQKEGAEVDSMP